VDNAPLVIGTAQDLDTGTGMPVDLRTSTGLAPALTPLARLACILGGSDVTANPWTALDRDCADRPGMEPAREDTRGSSCETEFGSGASGHIPLATRRLGVSAGRGRNALLVATIAYQA